MGATTVRLTIGFTRDEGVIIVFVPSYTIALVVMRSATSATSTVSIPLKQKLYSIKMICVSTYL